MICVIITFAILLIACACVLWFTRKGGPADIMRFWDEGQ